MDSETISLVHWQKQWKETGDTALRHQRQPGKCEAVSSIPDTIKKKKTIEKGIERFRN